MTILDADFARIIVLVGYAIEVVGVIVIVFGFVSATINRYRNTADANKDDVYHRYRRDLGRAMMLGLEFLVAGDIVRTVIVAHSITDVLSLGLVVLIRTVLVIAIHVEVEGRWPWQQPA